MHPISRFSVSFSSPRRRHYLSFSLSQRQLKLVFVTWFLSIYLFIHHTFWKPFLYYNFPNGSVVGTDTVIFCFQRAVFVLHKKRINQIAVSSYCTMCGSAFLLFFFALLLTKNSRPTIYYLWARILTDKNAVRFHLDSFKIYPSIKTQVSS